MRIFSSFWVWFLVVMALVSPKEVLGRNLLTIEEAVSQALGENRALKASEAEVSAYKAKIGVEASLEDPMFGVEFEDIPTNASNPQGAEEKSYFVVQKIPFPSKLLTKGAAAQKEYLSKKSALGAQQLAIIRETEHAYHRLYLARQSLKIISQLKSLFISLAKGEESAYLGDQSSATNFLKATVERDQLRSEEAMLKAQEIEMRSQLNILRHRDPEEDFEISDLLNHLHDIPSFDVLRERVLKNHPEIMEAKKTEEAMFTKASAVAQENFLPDFQTRVAYTDRGRMADAWTLELMMNVPFLWGKHYHEYRESKALAQKSKRDYEAVLEKRISELKEVYARYESTKKIDKIYRNEVLPNSSIAIQSAQAAYQSGGIDFLNLVDTMRLFKEAELKGIEAKVEYHKAITDLKYAQGGVL